MNITLDENLPERLVLVLSALGHDVDTVRREQLIGCADADVWSAAEAAQRFLITQDLDLSEMRRYTPGTHAGLLLVRLARPSRNALFERVTTVSRRRQSPIGRDAWSLRRTGKCASDDQSDEPSTDRSGRSDRQGRLRCIMVRAWVVVAGLRRAVSDRRIPSSTESSSLARSSARKRNTR